MPDIDTDFDDEGRQKVIDYVVDKYGRNQVAQIVTYGKMAAKMSLKDVARVMDLSMDESNSITRLVPARPLGLTLKQVINAKIEGVKEDLLDVDEDGEADDDRDTILLRQEDIPGVMQLREWHHDKKNLKEGEVLRQAMLLEGSVRNTGVHAAGIIIAPKDLSEIVPVAVAKDSNLLLTQFEGKVIEDAGVIKMDFLGLKTLSIIKTAMDLIKKNHGVDIDIDNLPLDDLKTFELYQRADTTGTFQFESPGMQKYLKELKPDKFEDLIAMNALYRPGPMEYIPTYIRRKHGLEEVVYDIPELEEYLSDTYGITVYQEQVMLLAQKLAGFTKGDADVLRKAMGKKNKPVLDKMKPQFVEGAAAKGHAKDVLEKVWTDWEAFAQYAFNKSHSTCYALVAYQTAYLKAHYPSEYMAAVLNHAGSIEKITWFMEECKRMGLTVLGPDINESLKGFAVNSKGEIRIGLGGLKGVGEAAVEAIIAERKRQGPFTSVFDLVKRVNQRTVNKKSLECLALSGAFDFDSSLHRGQYFHLQDGESLNGLEKIIRYGNIYQTQTANTSNTLFGDLPMMYEIPVPKITDCPPWSLTQILEKEKEVTGMFLSGHPLDHFRFELRYYGMNPISEYNAHLGELSNLSNPARAFRLAGLVTGAQHRVSRMGNKFGVLILEDFSGKFELTLFGDQYVKYASYFEMGHCLFVQGRFEKHPYKDDWSFRVSDICLLETIKKVMTRKIQMNISPSLFRVEHLDFLTENIRNHPGKVQLKFVFHDKKDQKTVVLSTLDKGFEMNDAMAEFLLEHPELEATVETS